MALDRQVKIYSVDTAAFYTDVEKEMEYELNLYKIEKSLLKKENLIIGKYSNNQLTQKQAMRMLSDLYRSTQELDLSDSIYSLYDNMRDIKTLSKVISEKKKKFIAGLKQHIHIIRRCSPHSGRISCSYILK